MESVQSWTSGEVSCKTLRILKCNLTITVFKHTIGTSRKIQWIKETIIINNQFYKNFGVKISSAELSAAGVEINYRAPKIWNRQKETLDMDGKITLPLHSDIWRSLMANCGNIWTEILKTHLKPSNALKTMRDVVAGTKARKQDLIEHKFEQHP